MAVAFGFWIRSAGYNPNVFFRVAVQLFNSSGLVLLAAYEIVARSSAKHFHYSRDNANRPVDCEALLAIYEAIQQDALLVTCESGHGE